MHVLHITKLKFYHLCMDIRVVVEKNICSYCWCVLFSRSACCPTPFCQMWLATRCGCWNAHMRPAAVTPPCSSPSPFPSVPSWSCSTSRTGFDALSTWYNKPHDTLNITFKSKPNTFKCITSTVYMSYSITDSRVLFCAITASRLAHLRF